MPVRSLWRCAAHPRVQQDTWLTTRNLSATAIVVKNPETPAKPGRFKVPKLATLMDTAEEDVLAYGLRRMRWRGLAKAACQVRLTPSPIILSAA